MKRILGIAVVLGLVGALTVVAQEVKPGHVEVEEIAKGIKLELVLIPAGRFNMGFSASEAKTRPTLIENKNEITITTSIIKQLEESIPGRAILNL